MRFSLYNVYMIKTFWFKLSDKIRFLLVGGFNAGVSYLIYSFFVYLLGSEAYQAALAIAWVVSSAVSFTTQKLLVFNVKGNIFQQYCKCCTTWVFSYIINACILEFFVKKLVINVYAAQLAATFVAAVFTYVMFKMFAFRK